MSMLSELAEHVIKGNDICRSDAVELTTANFEELLEHAGRIREHFFGSSVKLCSIVNAKCGACSEDCKFCAQSAHNKSSVIIYPLMHKEQMIAAADEATKFQVNSFGIVTSGDTLDAAADFERVKAACRDISAKNITACVSIGALSENQVRELMAAGVARVHHNLETSEKFFPKICTTHTWAGRADTVRAAKAAGAETCSGGLFGLGETWDDRIDLALELRKLDVNCAPINFLNPIPGTPLESRPMLEPAEALRIIAVYRFILGRRELQICGGRVTTLRELQPWMFKAGASGMMTGNYLTTLGRKPEDDIKMINELGLTLLQNTSKRVQPKAEQGNRPDATL